MKSHKFTRFVSIKNEALFSFTDLFWNAFEKTKSVSLMRTLFPNEDFRQRLSGVRKRKDFFLQRNSQEESSYKT